MPTRWARIALGALALSATVLPVLIGTAPTGASARVTTPSAPLELVSQTQWVSQPAPWFSLDMAVGESAIPVDQLHISVTFYSRVQNDSDFQQALNGSPQGFALERFPPLPVSTGPAGRTASTCVTVLPNDSVTPPTPPAGSGCIVGGRAVLLNCTLDRGVCGDVYPVAVSLLRQGSSTPLARLITFVTYEEPSGVSATGGALRVGLVVPVGSHSAPSLTEVLSDHRSVPTTLAVDPQAAASLAAHATRPADHHILDELQSLTAPGQDQLLNQPYVPINLAALEGARLGGEVNAQLSRGAQLLHEAGLHPSDGTWVDVASNLTQGSAASLASGLSRVRAQTVVLSDTTLSAAESPTYTPAHTFTLELPHGTHVEGLAADSTLGSRFSSSPGNPVLAASQLVAGLCWTHFEDAFLSDPRGIVLVPPAGWNSNAAFLNTLLTGLSGNPALSPVTLDQFANQVHVGTGHDASPATRRLQSGNAPGGGLTRTLAARIGLARTHLASFSDAAPSHPPQMTALSDELLSTEAAGMSTARRSAQLGKFDRHFGAALGSVSLATERTVTFTSRTAAIPITVLSSAPYPVNVVLTVQSDKFTFPSGNTKALTLDRPTTPIRLQAQARTSGDRIPVEVTLRTADGQLVIARTTVTIQSTAISLVGIALTVVALLVLLMWWGRTWRRSRQHRPRAH